MDAFPQRVRVQFLEEYRVDSAVLRGLLEFVGIDTAVDPVSWGRPENASLGPVPNLPHDVRQALKDYYADPDVRLGRLLGRALPWRRVETP
jgi:hypothetical protein